MSAPRRFLLVGLTGGIATGKSTVSDILRRLGGEIIDADRLARDVVEPEQPAWKQIVAEFGPGVVSTDGSLDRKKLGAIVFADPERRRRLEAITHPMIESGNYKNMDRLVVVVTDDATQAARLQQRDGTAEAEGRRKIASQMPLAEKAKLADYVIDNSGDREVTGEQVRRVFAALMSELNARSAV